MLDRPQVGDIVLVDSLWFFRRFFQAEITAIAENEMDSFSVDFCRYQVRPLQRIFRYRRWLHAWERQGIVSRAVDRQRQQEIEKLEEML